MKNYLIIAAVILIIFFVVKKKKKSISVNKTVEKINSGEKSVTELGQQTLDEQIMSSLKKIIDDYGVDVARFVEKIYRLETNHFKSGGFKAGFSPGMEKHADSFPFGWKSASAYWKKINFVPDFHTTPENQTGITKTFLKFPNVLIPMITLAEYVKKYSPERWYSLDPVKQSEYRNKLNGIKAKIVDKLWEK